MTLFQDLLPLFQLIGLWLAYLAWTKLEEAAGEINRSVAMSADPGRPPPELVTELSGGSV